MTFPIRHDDSPDFSVWTEDKLKEQIHEWTVRLQHAEQVLDMLERELKRREVRRRRSG